MLKQRLSTDFSGWLSRGIWLAWGVLVVVHLATIARVPAGLHYDEAIDALNALRIGRDGYWPVWIHSNYGLEPLPTYASWAAVSWPCASG
jgi:hypothetical protein